MTTPDLIAFIRSKLDNSTWDFHGPSIEAAVEKFEEDVRDEEKRTSWRERYKIEED